MTKELECLLLEKENESNIDDEARKMYENLEEFRRSAAENFLNKDEDGVY